MEKFVFSGLRMRVLLLVTLAMIPWLLTTIYHAVEERRAVVSNGQENALRLARIVSFDQRETIYHTRAMLQALAASPEIKSGTQAACRQSLADMFKGNRHYVNIGVVDVRGVLLCDALATQTARWFGDRDWFRQAVKDKQPVIGRLAIGRITGKPVVVAAQPVLDENGVAARVVWASIDIGWFQHLLEQIKLPQGVSVSVMDAHGVVVARQPERQDAIGKPNPLAALIQAIVDKKEEGVGQAVGTDGVDRLFAFRRLIERAGFDSVYVSLTTRTGPLLAKSNRILAREMGILALTVLVIFILVWYSINVLVLRKMKALIASARQIAKGNFNSRTHLGQDQGELGELARVFDDMAGSLELLFNQNQHIMEVTPEAIIISDSSGKIVMANAQAGKLFGYSRDEMLGASVETLVPERLRAAHVAHRDAYIALDAPPIKAMGKGRELFARKKDGSEFSTEISLGPLKTNDGNFVISAIRDVSERKEFEARILHQATHDALTGLPNRILFQDIVEHAMSRARRTEKLLAILFLDLDGFKNVNDTLGHEYGDILLKEVARRLTATLRRDDLIARDDDMVARQGGDEFIILLQGISVVQNIIQIAEKILLAVAEPFIADGHEMHVTVSVGITVFPFDDLEINHLLQNADTAMYRAKESGRNNFQFYTAEMNTFIRERMEIENGLRHALTKGELVLHYQPQMNIKTGKMVGVEALVRWAHPVKGLIPPGVFIPVAEESGLIVQLGDWVLRTACRQNKAWQDAGLPQIRMAVNLSVRQFRQPRLVEGVAGALADAGLDAHSNNLELELTESLLMQHTEDTIVTLRKLHQMGICLSIDDFGTGYSSLSYLKRFPIDTLKIDQSFIRDITTDPNDAAIAATIVTLAHNLKLKVIAEGVETAEQLALLRNMQCDQMQGYYFSRPVPPEELEKLLREGRCLI